MPDLTSSSSFSCLRTLLSAAGWTDAPLGRLHVAPTGTRIATDFPVADLGTAALAAVGLAASAVDEMRTGRRQAVAVDRAAASLAMASADYLRVDGRAPEKWDPVTGYYRCGDGGWAYLHGNFPQLRDGLLSLFGVPDNRAGQDDRDGLARRIATLPAQEVEDRAAAHGLCAVRRRDRADWRAHPQAAAVRGLPVVRLTRIGDAPPEPLPPGGLSLSPPGDPSLSPPGDGPLSGVRVLDLTRVIAGPMAGRTLAEHGATVMRIAAPHLPFIEPLVIDTGFGKRSAHVDLDGETGHERLRSLARAADIFIESYRPGALAARGFSPADLAELRPGMVSVSVSAFSSTGPWCDRRGYDTLVQAATGLASLSGNGPPRRLPCQPLDYLSGYLAAFGATVALLRRMTEGGSWYVEVSLARTAQWLWDMLDEIGPETAAPDRNPEPEDIAALLIDMDSAFGRLSALGPATTLSESPRGWTRPPVPLGTDSAEWP